MLKAQKLFELLPLETRRLSIQRVQPVRDAKALVKMDSDSEVQAFLGGVKTSTVQDRIQFLENEVHKSATGSCGQLAVIKKDDLLTIGFVRLKINEANCNATLSYIFDKEFWGSGYCNETCMKLLRVSFRILGLSKVCADTVPDNNNSMRVLMKLNMKPEGVCLEQRCIQEAGSRNSYVSYCITKDEFEQTMRLQNSV